MADTFGERLRALRNATGSSQGEIAKMFDTPKQTWSNWEVNLAMPRPDMIVRLAQHFNVTTDYLLGFEPGRAETVLRASMDKTSKEYHDLFERAEKAGISAEQVKTAIELLIAIEQQKKKPAP